MSSSNLTTLIDQLTATYTDYITFSSALFATAAAPASDGAGGFTLTPANSGVTWTSDTSAIGGSGVPEQIAISVPTLSDGGTPDPYALANGILEFTVYSTEGGPSSDSETFYAQILGWNNGIVAFSQLYTSYTPSDENGGTGALSGAVAGVPAFYLSNTALGANAAPSNGDVNTANAAPVFLDPQFPASPQSFLLNNPAGSLLDFKGNPWTSLVGSSFSSDNVAAISSISQDPTTLALSYAAGAAETFTASGNTNVTVVNAYNDAQVIELQYTSGGHTVDVYGQVIDEGFTLIGTTETYLLLRIYSGFDAATGALSGPDASLPYVMLSSASMASGVPAVTFQPTQEQLGTFDSSHVGPFNLEPLPLNLHNLFGVTSSGGGITINADQFAIAQFGVTSTLTTLSTSGDWTNDTTGAAVSGSTSVTVDAVYDDWQVVKFTVTGGPDGPQTLYGQIIGWNGAELGFQAFSSFDDVNGPSGSIDGMDYFVVADTSAAVSGASNTDNQFTPSAQTISMNGAPLFLNPSTPAPDLDLQPLVGTVVATPVNGGTSFSISGMSFNSDNVAFVNAVQQDPATLALSIVASGNGNTWTNIYGLQNNTTGSVVISHVYTYGQTQVAEMQFVTPTGGAMKTVYAQLLGYNADSLLLQFLTNFNPATGTWSPSVGSGLGVFNGDPYVVISDSSLVLTNGIPEDDVFTSDGALSPFGDTTPLAQVCFCAGTLIATPTGDRAVEQLEVGGMVRTHRGATSRIVWIGQGQVMVARGRRSPATPVIVRKGALADNVPHTDLRVTKGHAFLVDGVLIPVEFLVNHRSILWDDMAQEVTIYHVELERHDVLLANGAPAESYRDDGNRWLFQNGNSGWEQPAKPPCAPVLTGGVIVDAAWRRLLDRAGPRCRVKLTLEADLHLLVDGRRIDSTAAGPALVFVLPASFCSVRIVSRAAVPAELGLARDPRALGVALRGLVLRRGAWFRAIDLADPALACGFHDYEPAEAIRWTNGDADVPVALLTGPAGGLELVLHLGGATQYIDEGKPAAMVA